MNEMIEVKVSELEGAALDWAVAKAVHGCDPWQIPSDVLGYWYAGECDGGNNDWSPSTDWSQGGPLLAKYFNLITGMYPSTDMWPDGDNLLPWAMRAIVTIESEDPLDAVVQVPAALVAGGAA